MWLCLQLGWTDPDRVRELPAPLYSRWREFYWRNAQHPLSLRMTIAQLTFIASKFMGGKPNSVKDFVWPAIASDSSVDARDGNAVAAMLDGLM